MKVKKLLYVFVWFIILPILSGGVNLNNDDKKDIGKDWLYQIQDQIQKSEYRPSLQDMDYSGNPFPQPRCHFVNRVNNLRAYFDDNGMQLIPRLISEINSWCIKFQLTSTTNRTKPIIEGDKIIYTYPGFTEEYSNSEDGIIQYIIINENLDDNAIVMKTNITTDNIKTTLLEDKCISFNCDNTTITYELLDNSAVENKSLDVKFVNIKPNEFGIFVKNKGATYPLEIAILIASSGSNPVIIINNLHSTPNWEEESNQIDAYFGQSVSTAGDVNGDGFSDVIVGAHCFDNGQTDEGKVFAYYGSTNGLPITGASWTKESNLPGIYFGYSVSTAGDVNGDGYSDVIIGAPYYSNSQTYEGRAYVYYGSSTGLTSTPWTYESNDAYQHLGCSVSTAGDVNGDGFSDVIIGARGDGDFEHGHAHVFHGQTSGLLSSPNWTGEIEQNGDLFGESVSIAGDVNGDGYADVIVGAPLYDNGQSEEGGAFFYYGHLAGLSQNYDWHYEGQNNDHNFGWSVSTAGDVNGDGYSDVIIGELGHYNYTGMALVFKGGADGLTLNQTWVGEATSDRFGYSVSTAGDVNGDGYSDVIVGTPYWSSDNYGKTYLYYGSVDGSSASCAWTTTGVFSSEYYGWSVNTAGDVNGDGYSDVIVGAPQYSSGQRYEGRAYVYYGSPDAMTREEDRELNQADAGFGYSVSTAGDVNGDGFSDVIIGAPYWDGGQTNEGKVWVYKGLYAGLSTAPIWSKESDQIGALFGSSVATAGDVNNDGFSDIIVGASDYDNGQTDEGKAWVYHGSSIGPSSSDNWNAESNQNYAYFGSAVSTAGDVNGDGYSDVIVGSYLYDNGQTDEGAAFVYHGSTGGLSPTYNRLLETNQNGARIRSVATAGDINRDGFSDVIVGSNLYDNGQTDEGRVFVYMGSPSGIPSSANQTLELDQANAQFGYSVSTAGDVNGDGYSDVIIGAPTWDWLDTDDGCAFVFWGSSSGIVTTIIKSYPGGQANELWGYSVSTAGDVDDDGNSEVIIGSPNYDNGQTDEGRITIYKVPFKDVYWTKESNQAGANLGICVSTAGDINGDGFSDVIIGAHNYDGGQTNEGRATVCFGGSGGRIGLAPRQITGSRLVQLSNGTSGIFLSLKALVKSPAGRSKVYLEWEVKNLSQPMNGNGLGTSINWYDTGLNGVEITQAILGLSYQTPYHWRLRVKYSPVYYNGAVHSRWFSIGPNSWNEMDFRTAANAKFSVIDELTASSQSCMLSVLPSMSSNGFQIIYNAHEQEILPVNKSIHLQIYDAAGRLVKTLYNGELKCNTYTTTWNGMDNNNQRVESSVYFIVLQHGENRMIKKILLMK